MNSGMANTRERILDVAQELIQRRGLNAMSFQDLSDSIGIRKASIHHHFASKAKMVEALCSRYRREFEILVSRILQSGASGKTKLRRYFDLFAQTAKGDKNCLFGILIAELSSLDEEGREQVHAFSNENIQWTQQILRDGVSDGSLLEISDLPKTAEMVFATLEGGLLLSRLDGGAGRYSGILARMLTMLAVK